MTNLKRIDPTEAMARIQNRQSNPQMDCPSEKVAPKKIIKPQNLLGRQKINSVRTSRGINRQIVDQLIEMKHCTLLTLKKFKCDEFWGAKLIKGKEEQCHCPDFLNCPAFNHYINHEFLMNRRKIAGTKKTEATQEKKEEARKKR